ncbi:MAG: HEAT repeat domain-containing protein [Rhizobacter sp.]|nr:HEAT repeat domain-containing protein [Bacteriovorax sp.]
MGKNITGEKEILLLIEKLDVQGDIQAEKMIQKISKFGVKAVPFLIKAAQDEEYPRIMKWSLLALGTIGDKKGLPVLIKALGHERMTVKFHALGGLARFNNKASAKKVALLLNDESGGVRGRALKTLMTLNNKSVATSILPLFSDPMWYIRQDTCKASEQFKMASAIPLLITLEKSDEKKAVRTAASKALKVLRT